MSQSESQNRQVAKRVFATEINRATKELDIGEGERSPNYVLLPTGDKVNRVFFVGVLTNIKDVGSDNGEYWQAQVTTGNDTAYVYAGDYTPDIASYLKTISNQDDEFKLVAVMGKLNVWGDEGDKNVSIRPETFQVLTEDAESIRDQWMAEAAEATIDRLKTEEGENVVEGVDLVKKAREEYDCQKEIVEDVMQGIEQLE